MVVLPVPEPPTIPPLFQEGGGLNFSNEMLVRVFGLQVEVGHYLGNAESFVNIVLFYNVEF